jgi:hypothetical protein
MNDGTAIAEQIALERASSPDIISTRSDTPPSTVPVKRVEIRGPNVRTEERVGGVRWVRRVADPAFHRYDHTIAYPHSREDGNWDDVYVCGGKLSTTGQLSDGIFHFDRGNCPQKLD